MELSEILNWSLGGGLVATIVALITLKPTVMKAKGEAEAARAQADRAKAEADTVRITNTEKATRILMDNIVEPLKKELNATRREMVRLRKALNTASACDFHDDCPVLRELQQFQKDGATEPGEDGNDIPANPTPFGGHARHGPTDG
ncbi:MAG: hypothetical protein K6E86_02090 [Bacteroidales bacterium]|nr:hypothetical protein [Bacteroidales bacterium]